MSLIAKTTHDGRTIFTYKGYYAEFSRELTLEEVQTLMRGIDERLKGVTYR